MIARFEDRGKVGCHNETVENQELEQEARLFWAAN